LPFFLPFAALLLCGLARSLFFAFFEKKNEKERKGREMLDQEAEEAGAAAAATEEDEITQEDAWTVITAYFEEKGLRKEQRARARIRFFFF
jgi:hypothetical protein